VHRTQVLRRPDVCFTVPPTTSAPRSVVDAASWARSDAEARTIVAMSYQQGLVFGDQVDSVLREHQRVRRRDLIRRTAADARGGSHSLAELDLVTLCRKQRLPVPTRQVFRPDASGRTRYLDAAFEPWGVRVEIDGAHHMAVDEWWNDMRRHNDLARRGEVLLRFPAWLVRDRPSEVAMTIRGALRDAGWR
jgi:very-short-patch-repair endonuclease